MSGIVEIRETFHCGRKRLFEALTDPDIIEEWSEQNAVFEPFPEGKVRLFNRWVKGRVVSCEKGRAIAFTWQPAEWGDEAVPSLVTYSLEKSEGKVHLTIRQENFPSEQERKSHREGWYDHVINPVREYLETKGRK